MPTENERIAGLSERMFNGKAWHGPSITEALADVDAATAAAFPIPGAHSIWELVLHLWATQDILLRRISGEQLSEGGDLDWWPVVSKHDEESWRDTLVRLQQQEDKLRTAMELYPEESLDSVLVDGGMTVYNNFHGHIQHNAYHAGQICLLKKAWRAR